MSLSNKAMLVNLSISLWSARKYDKKVSQEVAVKHNTSDNVGRYNKNLLPVDSKSYAETVKFANEARVMHYKQTLPWNDNGSRILPAGNYLEYMKLLREQRAKFELAYTVFVSEYPTLHTNAQAILNGLYDSKDYPSQAEMSRKFSFHVKVYPMPDKQDFRVSLGDGEVDSIREQIERDTNNAVANAMKDLYNRLHIAVSHMAEKLSDPKGIFRDSLVSNIRELCDLLPRLNLSGDATLEAKRIEIQRELASFEPEEIRNDARVRSELARKAQVIQNDLAGYMGAV